MTKLSRRTPPIVHLSLLALIGACTAGDDAPADTDPVTSPLCDGLDLPTARFVTDADVVNELGAIATDFTADLLDGSTYTWSDAWSGCESYLFFVHFPGRNDGTMRTSVTQILRDAPKNVQFFFLSDADTPADRRTFLEEVSTGVNAAIDAEFTGKKVRDEWRERFHFVTTRATKVEGSVGEFLTGYLAWSATPDAVVDLGDRGQAGAPLPQLFGFDRAQRIDAGDSLSPAVGQSDALGMAAYLGQFYNYRYKLDARLDADPGTAVTVLDELTTGRVFTKAVELPDADELATYDQLEVDVTIDCREGNPFACSEWDRIAWVWVCADGEACTERRELARWITPYWRRGRQRYAIDASALLPLLADGGTQHLFIELGPDWERATEWYANVTLRFRDTGGAAPTGIVPTFGGGTFDTNYNTREPIPFTPPTGTTRVELVTLLTGHGQTGGNNCAEWCDHRHTFRVNDASDVEVVWDGAAIGSATGCANRAKDGVIPGQWGNWAQARAYWCPGLPVPATSIDITPSVTIGAENTLDYTGAYGTGAPAGGDIALSSYLVYYTD